MINFFKILNPISPHAYLHLLNPQALNAQAAGAKGLILYSDPADYAIDDGNVQVYPDGWWLPETGAQRGNTFVSDAKGDPVTPGYPAKRRHISTYLEELQLSNNWNNEYIFKV